METLRPLSTHEERLAAFRAVDVYPVVTSEFCRGDSFGITRAVLEGGAKIVQIREKTMCDGDFLPYLRRFRGLTLEYGALLIVDDRVDAALAADADGVHLGQEDFPPAEARRIAPELLIGVSTHDEAELLRAQEEGCSYLNIGPIFPTKTKSLSCPFLGLETLRRLAPLVRVPFTVMGGIKFESLPALREAGARRVAAVTAFTQAEDPAAEVAGWRRVLAGEG